MKCTIPVIDHITRHFTLLASPAVVIGRPCCCLVQYTDYNWPKSAHVSQAISTSSVPTV